jgi:hypothetical protein
MKRPATLLVRYRDMTGEAEAVGVQTPLVVTPDPGPVDWEQPPLPFEEG